MSFSEMRIAFADSPEGPVGASIARPNRAAETVRRATGCSNAGADDRRCRLRRALSNGRSGNGSGPRPANILTTIRPYRSHNQIDLSRASTAGPATVIELNVKDFLRPRASAQLLGVATEHHGRVGRHSPQRPDRDPASRGRRAVHPGSSEGRKEIHVAVLRGSSGSSECKLAPPSLETGWTGRLRLRAPRFTRVRVLHASLRGFPPRLARAAWGAS